MSEAIVEKTNRLINEKSPYLLQHAHNPVDWYPWCEEAFDKAKKEDKPIFLSIGYSTCHWCHVMEKESFEDEQVARILNNNFISVKVDREERPDVDSVYMTVCQMMAGAGGWPLTIIMTPDKKPFFAGTYFPKENKYGVRGLVEILNYIIGVWRDDKNEILKNSEHVLNYINEANIFSPEPIDIKSIEKAFEELSQSYEINYGGFSIKPKFPSPQNIYFLLRYYKQTGSKKALAMATNTLDSMYKGGIFDHIGYGFSRYSTDERWLVPHFEKMLYDNALLAIAYTEAYVVTGKKLYKDVTEKIFSYVLRDMQHEEGAFYCAEDADSEGVEGKFYLWSYDEIRNILGENDTELFCQYYGISREGNFEGKNIPNLNYCNLEKLYENNEIKDRLEDMNKRLFEVRERRIHPHKDDKILTSWNGMMIAALAYCGRVLENDIYIENAKRTITFMYKYLFNNEGRLLARYRKGEVMHLGYIDDYAFLLWGLVELYEATFEGEYLKKAVALTKGMEKYFWDKEDGAFFLYGSDGEKLIWRPKEVYDGAIPSGNSVAALNMLRLARITKNMDLETMVSRMFTSLGGKIQSIPSAYAYFMTAVMYGCSGGKEIIIAGDKSSSEVKKIQRELNKEFQPFSIIVLNNEDKALKEVIPQLENNKKVDNKTTVYICQDFSCREPLTDIDKALNIIKEKELDIRGYYPDLS